MAFDSQPPNTQENRERLKGLFVDVGCGSYPAIDWGARKFGKDENYLGLDLDAKKIAELSEKYNANPNVKFVKVEGDQDEFYFPVPDGTATEVHIANVFGIPGAVDTHNLQLVLEESVRILKEGGILSILENLTPNYSREQFETILKLYPVKIVLSITPRSTEWKENIAEYDKYTKDLDPEKGWNDSYYLIKAEKHSAISH